MRKRYAGLRQIVGMMTFLACSTMQAQTNYALQFNGTDQYVMVPDNPSLHITSSITIEAWVNKYANVQWASVLTKGDTDPLTDNNYTLHFASTGGMIFTGATQANSSLVFPLNEWHHVAVTWDGSLIKFYIDSTLDTAVTSFAGPLISNDHSLIIGADFPGTDEYFPGRLDEVRVWNVARTQQQIQDYMHQPLTGTETGLVAYWKFDDGSGSTLNDASASGNTGTLMNNPTWVLSDVTLPVELSVFTASLIGSSAMLKWRTETEINDYGFEIERSTNSASTARWSKIGFVSGAGTSNAPHEYSFIDQNPFSGRNAYRIKQIDQNGSFKYYGSVEVEFGAPVTFSLEQNFPNPFNPSTTIVFRLPSQSYVSLKVFDAMGREVSDVYTGELPAGEHRRLWDAAGLPSGMYFYRLLARNASTSPAQGGEAFTETRKLLLLR